MDLPLRLLDDYTAALAAGRPPPALPQDKAERIEAAARARLAARGKVPEALSLWLDDDTLRYCTPWAVAHWRAEAFPTGALVCDLACGAGIQLAALAARHGSGLGVELDARRVEMARWNVERLAPDVRVEIIQADAASDTALPHARRADGLFLDPARPPGAPSRHLGGLSPDPRVVLQRHGPRRWTVELPPQMPPQRVLRELEPVTWLKGGTLEYTGLGPALNRLALHVGHDLPPGVRVALLPQRETLDVEAGGEVPRARQAAAHVLEVHPAVVQAGGLATLARVLGAAVLQEDPRRALLTTDAATQSPWVRTYATLDTAPWARAALQAMLARVKAGKVTLRAKIDPKAYWAERRALEADLHGDVHVHLFQVASTGVAARPLHDPWPRLD